MSDEENQQKMVDQAAQKLGEYYDHVLIICCKDEQDEEFMNTGQNGNRRAIYSMAKEYVMREEDAMRYGDQPSDEGDD